MHIPKVYCSCGYDALGHTSRNCPECGKDIVYALRRQEDLPDPTALAQTIALGVAHGILVTMFLYGLILPSGWHSRYSLSRAQWNVQLLAVALIALMAILLFFLVFQRLKASAYHALYCILLVLAMWAMTR